MTYEQRMSLHDDIGRALTYLTYALRTVESADVSDNYASGYMAGQAKAAIHTARGILTDLSVLAVTYEGQE